MAHRSRLMRFTFLRAGLTRRYAVRTLLIRCMIEKRYAQRTLPGYVY